MLYRMPKFLAKIMQPTGYLHDQIIEAFFQIATHIFDYTATLNAWKNILYNNTSTWVNFIGLTQALYG